MPSERTITPPASILQVEPVAPVADAVRKLFATTGRAFWLAASPDLGTYQPALLAVSYRPEVTRLAALSGIDADVLATIRRSGRVRAETIATRLQRPVEQIRRQLDRLRERELASVNDKNRYTLTEICRTILFDVVSVERLVGGWKPTLRRAVHNRNLAHRSFVIASGKKAAALANEEAFETFGIGILACDAEADATIFKPAARSTPFAWESYFQLGRLTAKAVAG